MDVFEADFQAPVLGAAKRQRARGEVRAVFARAGERTEAERVFETGGLRARFPRSGVECETVVVNTGGGMAGGDRASVDLALREGARVLATTQSAEKIYRADGLGVEVDVRLEVGAGARLVWAPQETILFEGSRFRRRLEANLAPDASLLMVESTVFGRLAHGEASVDADFRDDWRIRRGGALVFAEAVRIADAGATLDRLAVGRGARALATLLYVTPDAPSRLDEVRAVLEEFADDSGDWLEAGASIVDGALVARALSPAPHRLRAALTSTLRVLRGREAPRVWG